MENTPVRKGILTKVRRRVTGAVMEKGRPRRFSVKIIENLSGIFISGYKKVKLYQEESA